ncbi:MAG: HAD family hydrolase, partial [Deltaproteobacteria bacterium]
ELEGDLAALQEFAPKQRVLRARMAEKEELEARISYLRLQMQRKKTPHGPPHRLSEAALQGRIAKVRAQAVALDDEIRPLAEAAARLPNPEWGSLMRAGNDKSHLARQVERYADIYMSRVSNFLWQTPYSYMRALRGTLPHDILDTADR